MSIADNKLFFNPNCNGVKARLKIIFNIKGSKTKKGISFLINIRRTFPYEIAISKYNIDQTGPKIQEGGDHVGFINCEYQLYEFITLIISKN
jgi:hypothetical protein